MIKYNTRMIWEETRASERKKISCVDADGLWIYDIIS